MSDKFKKHGMRLLITLALCLGAGTSIAQPPEGAKKEEPKDCLLYTSDAADE